MNILTEVFNTLQTDKAVLEIWGNGGDDSIQSLINRIKNNNKISYSGPYESNKVGEVLSKFDVLIVPSFNETYSIVIREALVCKIPVIASNRGAIPEIINSKNGFLFEPDAPHELLQIINKIIDDPGIINNLKMNIKPVLSIQDDTAEWNEYYNNLNNNEEKIETEIIQTESTINNKDNTVASIIIPTFNNLKYTKDCLTSLQVYTNHINYELIIIDNASTDGTQEYLNKEIKKFKQGKLIFNEENLGFAKACNQGIKESKSKYVVLLNNDTTVMQDWLDNLLKEADSDSSVGIVGSCLLYPGNDLIQHAGVSIGTEDGKTLAPYHIHRLGKLSETPQACITRNCTAVTGACMLLSTEMIQTIGYLDEEYINGLEDIDYCFRALTAGFKVRYCAESKLYHHESISPNRHKNDIPNWQRLNSKWLGKIPFDETQKETIINVSLIKKREELYTSKISY